MIYPNSLAAAPGVLYESSLSSGSPGFALALFPLLRLDRAAPDKLAQADALLASPTLDYQKGQQALALYESILRAIPPY